MVPALVAFSVQVPLPRLIVRAPEPVPENAGIALNVTLLLLALKSNVPVNAPQVIVCTVTVVLTVTVPPPDEPSRVALSAEPGTDAPLAPPDEAAQCDVSLASHVPVPPTQNLEAIGHRNGKRLFGRDQVGNLGVDLRNLRLLALCCA